MSLDARGTHLELFIRRLPDGRLSNLVWRRRLGARLVGPAHGLFMLDLDDRRPRVLIGTGTGSRRCWPCSESADSAHDRRPPCSSAVHRSPTSSPFGARSRRHGSKRGAWLEYRPTVLAARCTRATGAGADGRVALEAQLGGSARGVALAGRWRPASPTCAATRTRSLACSDVLRGAGFALDRHPRELFHPPEPRTM